MSPGLWPGLRWADPGCVRDQPGGVVGSACSREPSIKRRHKSFTKLPASLGARRSRTQRRHCDVSLRQLRKPRRGNQASGYTKRYNIKRSDNGLVDGTRCVSSSLVEIARFGQVALRTLNLPRISVLFRSAPSTRGLVTGISVASFRN
jgi:hypothetical protein